MAKIAEIKRRPTPMFSCPEKNVPSKPIITERPKHTFQTTELISFFLDEVSLIFKSKLQFLPSLVPWRLGGENVLLRT
jgi:hypothetical protein